MSKQDASHTFRAFISYSHADKETAKWLHRSLERYKLPKKLVGKSTSLGPVPKRLSPIFRDQDELSASGNLDADLQSALVNSMFLIVVCSPSSAKSKWVNEEVRQFKALHGKERVLALVIDGTPNAITTEQECFPPALKFELDANGNTSEKLSEPIAADLRKAADGKKLASLKIISGLTGLRLDDLVQRDASRRMLLLIQVSVASSSAAIFALALAFYANEQRIEATKQRAIAEQESKTAIAVSDFLVNSFVNASSEQENPNEVTARTILDRGAKRILQDLEGQAVIQARLSTTIAKAFTNLGLFDNAIDVVDKTAKVSGLQISSATQMKAQALFRQGKLDESLQTATLAEQLLQEERQRNDKLNDSSKFKTLTDIASMKAIIYSDLGEFELALDEFDIALKVFEQNPDADTIELVSLLQRRALLLSDMGEMETASADLSKAKSLLLNSVGEQDIFFGNVSLAQAQVDFLSWNLEPALFQITQAIENFENLLERDNPTLADALSMKGQILHGLGRLKEAELALTEAVSIYTNAFNGRHYLSGIAEVYLGLIAGDRKNLASALAHFQQAKLHYDEGYGGIHANHGDLLVNQATVLSSLGEIDQAKTDCAEGMRILNETLGQDAAFTQQLQEVCNAIYAL
ncbi:TIR domain-containing protein [Glaciecola sp. KUL10]|uniref:TIR domain-containing protein n=1 Tax=Glaciecola sp. (strain KUL10) TaxID=2161813 RepID=UPI000D785D36|nr:TIR domain-containing protein [Glaciecola sp. KUL10]GBL03422.1 hypothetical protein KUL10_07100 [Glaciecola sp. KUL10]